MEKSTNTALGWWDPRNGEVGLEQLEKEAEMYKLKGVTVISCRLNAKAVNPLLKMVYAEWQTGDPNGIRTRVTAVKGRNRCVVSGCLLVP